jgi:glycosyltransferase involved in cell wall biosynthesis
MHLGRRDKVPFPDTYKAFRLVRTHGRVFGLPTFLDPESALKPTEVMDHPASVSAGTLDELLEQLDGYDLRTVTPEVVGRCAGYDVVRLGGWLYAVPDAAKAGDLNLPHERRRAGAVPAENPAELEVAVRAAAAAAPVEFAGWLPVFQVSGNCGQHPQFGHVNEPPPGYRFTCSAPPERPSRWAKLGTWLGKKATKAAKATWGTVRLATAFVRPRRGVTLAARVRVFAAVVRLVFALLARGCGPLAILRFLQTRHLQSQLLLGDRKELVFLTSMPYTVGQNPWVIEVEDPTTLFYPMIQNGNTCGLDVRKASCFRVIQSLLEADHCRAILTHVRSTAELIPTLFGSETIRKKVVYAPLGVKLPARWQRHAPQPPGEPIDLLFINSWCQIAENFFVRGGLDVLEAFAILRERYPQLRLTIRTRLPALDHHYHRILESGWVRIIDRFMPAEEMAELHAKSHVFLLPAARLHVVSLLQAMSYGLAVVASDGWGMEEYVEHERNGLVVKGRYAKTSWADAQAGLLRENYEPTYVTDPEVVRGIVEAVSELVEDPRLRARLGRTARADVETRFNLARWNEGLKAAFDLARGGTPNPVGGEFDPGRAALPSRQMTVR